MLRQVSGDKANHYMYASLIAFGLINVNLFGGAIVALVGILGYEVYQKVTGKGVFDWWDILFGVAGIATILLTGMNVN